MASSTETVAQFEALLARAKTHAQGEDIIGMLLGEISTALADILAQMEKPEPQEDHAGMAAALAQAFRAAVADMKAPVIHVAPAVTVAAPSAGMQPAPVVNVSPVLSIPSGTQYSVKINRSSSRGPAESLTITKL